MQACNVSKPIDNYSTPHKQTLGFPKVRYQPLLKKKAYKSKQANNFGMKRLSKRIDINKGQEVPSVNLNLQTKAAQYLVQKGQAKEGGRGGKQQNKYTFFLI